MYRNLIIILAIALLLRLALPFVSYVSNGNTQRFFSSDTATYVLPAQSLLNTGHYAVNGQPDLLRPPGYPLFLTPGLLLDALFPVTLAIQMLLSLTTVLLVYHLALKLTNNNRPALCAAFLAAIEPLGPYLPHCSQQDFTRCYMSRRNRIDRCF